MSRKKIIDEYIGSQWSDIKGQILTPDERKILDLEVQLISELIMARKNKKLTQKDLESISGVKQPVIARAESMDSDPQISTILRILAPLGKTLSVVEIE